MNVRLVTPRDREYPPLLREVPGRPVRLFVTGRTLEPAPYIAVVGTRRPSRYGLEVAAAVAGGLAASGATVVSGMAAGIDAAAHEAALEAGGMTVAVLGCGLDVCYPARNADLYRRIRRAGSAVSEYEAGTRPLPYHFPTRNRIIAGMCLGVVVVEGRRHGGAMITARLAADYGREVLAVAGPVHGAGSEGPHALVREGARLVTSAADVLEDLGLSALSALEGNPTPKGVLPALGPDERRVMEALEADPILLDLIARRTAMPPSSAAAVLSRLELLGLASRHPGCRFARSVAAAPSPGLGT